MEGRVGLADAIAQLRAELCEAVEEGRQKQIRFGVGPVELEFHVELGREGGGSGKVRFWVVEAGAEGKLSSKSTQVLKIRLEPMDAATRKQVLAGETGDAAPTTKEPVSGPSAAVG